MTAADTRSPQSIRLSVLDADQHLDLQVTRLIVAGYTGRDQAAVKKHIDELAAIGVPPPPQVPMLFDLDPALLTTADVAQVDGDGTSGEVEPVVILHQGQWFLGVGSDHTDRALEKIDIARSKAACPKPLGKTVVPLPDGLLNGAGDSDWDATVATCEVDGEKHQAGNLSALRLPSDLLPLIVESLNGQRNEDVVIYCGTVPTLGGEFRMGTTWTTTLTLRSGAALSHSYRLERSGT